MWLTESVQEEVRVQLTQILGKYSDADVGILSDYIIALLAKDGMSDKILAKDCEEELSAFMGEKTSEFVQQLFKILNSVRERNANTGKSANKNTNGRKIELVTDKREAVVQTKVTTNVDEKHSVIVSQLPMPLPLPSKHRRVVELQSNSDEENMIIAHITNNDAVDDQPRKVSFNGGISIDLKSIRTSDFDESLDHSIPHASHSHHNIHHSHHRSHSHSHRKHKNYYSQNSSRHHPNISTLSKILGILQQNPSIIQSQNSLRPTLITHSNVYVVVVISPSIINT